MINWLARKISGDPCIGCNVRERALHPEKEAARDGMRYLPGIEFDSHGFKLQQVAGTCLRAFEGQEMSTTERFEACKSRASDPDAVVKAVAIRLQTIPTEA